MGFAVLLILFVLISSVSAANDNITSLSQDNEMKLAKSKFQLEMMIPA
jgi:hypothetical protein